MTLQEPLKLKMVYRWLFLTALVWHPHGVCGELRPYAGVDEHLSLQLPDLSGQMQRLQDHRGSVVLVNFWASWCAPCLIEMPGMQRLLDGMARRPFTILAVNVAESSEKAWRFTNLLNVDFATLLDSDGATAKAWAVQVFPTSFLVDANGDIRYVAYGAINWDNAQARQLIEQIMPDRHSAPGAKTLTASD